MNTTITITEETKRMLASLKGRKTWDEFLTELAEVYRRERVERALKELREIPRDEKGVKMKLRLGEY